MKAEENRLHAYLDGELDAAASLEFEAQMAENPALRAACERQRELSAAIRGKADYHPAPIRLYRVEQPASKSFKFISAFALVALVAFGLGTLLTFRAAEDPLAREVVASHVRATLGGRLIDVASSDQHTVKPWLSARLPFSPPVTDLSQDGFELAGARLDYAAGQPVAVLVYKRRQHVVDVFVWPAAGESEISASARDGFNVARFARGGMRYWVVSDLNRNELDDFARLLAARR
ncbi:MAG TPA: anti-sigma factor [Burkholderiales bacterium]|nr:anti-sigma factor [Burkholderiales bacterium]